MTLNSNEETDRFLSIVQSAVDVDLVTAVAHGLKGAKLLTVEKLIQLKSELFHTKSDAPLDVANIQQLRTHLAARSSSKIADDAKYDDSLRTLVRRCQAKWPDIEKEMSTGLGSGGRRPGRRG